MTHEITAIVDDVPGKTRRYFVHEDKELFTWQEEGSLELSAFQFVCEENAILWRREEKKLEFYLVDEGKSKNATPIYSKEEAQNQELLELLYQMIQDLEPLIKAKIQSVIKEYM